MSNDMSLAQAENGQRPRPSAAFGARGIEVRHYDELARFAQTVSESGLAPKGMEKPQAIFVAMQMGMELGLTPMASLQNVAVVNGRPTLWGDAILAVCRGTGEMELFEEWYETGGVKSPRNPTEYKDDTAAVCRVKRAGGQAIEQAFSVSDAKRAGLWGKQGPWSQYPFRMLRNRARSFALRDGFGDALRGFRSTEEERDSPEIREVTGREVPAANVPQLFSGVAESLPVAEKPAPDKVHPAAVSTRRAKAADPSEVVESPAAAKSMKEARPKSAPAVAHEAPAETHEEDEPREKFWAACDAAKMDDLIVMAILKENGLTDGQYPADLTNDEAVNIRPIWKKLVSTYAEKGGAK